MEVDPGFIGPAALAKAYRFVGDPRDDQQFERLNDLAQDPQGIFDCTHCFKCVEACPKDVNPMGQIMRLRRIAISDHHIVDANNGERHEAAFTGLIKDNGLLWEAELLPRSYGGNSWFGKFAPPAGKELLSSLPAILKALIRGKVTCFPLCEKPCPRMRCSGRIAGARTPSAGAGMAIALRSAWIGRRASRISCSRFIPRRYLESSA